MRTAFDPTFPASLIGDTLVHSGALEPVLPFRVDDSTDLGGGVWEYTLVLQKPSADGRSLEDHDSGYSVVAFPVDPDLNTVADDTLVWARYRGSYASEYWEFVTAKAGALNTQNVDGTEDEPDTTDIRFDQSTFIKVEQLTSPKRARVYLDTAELCANTAFADCVRGSMTFDVLAAPVFDVCVEVSLTKTYSEVPGEEHLMTNAVPSVSVFLEKKTLTMLEGTGVGDSVCTPATSACCDSDPPVETACCPGDIPAELVVTISGGGGDYVATWDGTAWDTGVITIPGCGTARLTLSCTGTDATGFIIGNGVGGDCIWATGLGVDPATCDPFEFVASGTFSGFTCGCTTKTLTWGLPA